ncbi:type I-E CRISPR-associated protein Cse2/CasB [Enterovirga sp.]|uniref:type I-E CRISPR-associated protein Cse2/CasB n=1 Tax=Enterovirga sp. TaxID=2026350 RepID=UPI002D1FAEB8|nr:type I-E CRISPR-associated protein Cse2/CasB [Enterovirga sp.]
MQPDPGGGTFIRARVIARMAARMAHEDSFGRGPLAELRRLDPSGALADVALHRLLARHVPEARLAQIGLPAWALVIHAAALAAPDSLAFPPRASEPPELGKQAEFWAEAVRGARQRFGRELFEAGYGEGRFAILLDASAEALPDALPRAVRFLVAKGRRLPVLAIADLVMSSDEPESEAGKSIRQGIARGYFRAEAKAASPQAQTVSGDAA